MKRFRSILVIGLLVLALLVACAPAAGFAQKVVTLPDPLANAIIGLCVFVVGWIFAQIGVALPWFVKLFGQYADEVAFALAGAFIASIQKLLNAIPPQWESPANAFLVFLVAVLAALQTFHLLGKAQVRSFRA